MPTYDTPEKIVRLVNNIAKFRNLTIDEVLKQAGIGRATWFRWKSGKAKPSDWSIERLRKVNKI